MKVLRAATMLAMLIPALAPAQGSLAPDAAIRAQTAAYAAAINKRDAAAVGALFTADGDVTVLDGPRTMGRGAITESTKKDLATWPAARKIGLMVTTVRTLTPDVVIVETTATFTEGPIQTNRGTSVMVRQDGKWLISALRVYPAVATK